MFDSEFDAECALLLKNCGKFLKEMGESPHEI